ncbi:pilus assembly protein [Streptomyces armeniacus]|uniref:Pilus assembly protein n=2 Tax=Streptomyces armeniacus TaxID=83291 RepID=A0A345Y1T2_9ACTN|nr:pilus assembly protein [Streptomyces armeniacus]
MPKRRTKGREPPAAARTRPPRPGSWLRLRTRALRRSRERGASSIEFTGMLPLLLLVGLAAIQLGLAGYAVQQAGTGARAGARTASHEDRSGECAGAGKSAMSGWTADRSSFDCARDDEEATVTTKVTIPSIIPGIDSFGAASRTVTMPSD